MLTNQRLQTRVLWLLVVPLLMVAAVVSTFAVRAQRNLVVRGLDDRLLTAAHCACALLGDTYHDRINGADSVSTEAYTGIIDTIDDLARRLDVDFLGSVLLLDDQVVFTSAAGKQRDGTNTDSVAFLQVHADPVAYTTALTSQAVDFGNYGDIWGAGRMALVPGRDERGRPFAFAAGIADGTRTDAVRTAVVRTLAVCVLLTLGCVALCCFLVRSFYRPLLRLRQVAARMTAGEYTELPEVGGGRELRDIAHSLDVLREGTLDQVERVRASEENLAITLNSIADAVIATNNQGEITGLNKAAEVLTAWSEADAVGMPLAVVFRIVDTETREDVDSPVDRILGAGEAVLPDDHTSLLARDGNEHQISASAEPIRDRNGGIVGVVLVFRDITDEYAMQEQLRQVQRMEAIGQLAGGIAHDFNNLLTPIMGNAQLLINDLQDQQEQLELSKQIMLAAERASYLTWQLLAFSRKGDQRENVVDLHRVIEEVHGLLARTIDRRIEIKTFYQATDAQVLGDPTQLQNMVLNLGVNARDAMTAGGELSFTTREVELEEAFCQSLPSDIEAGSYIELAVSDTGIGMDQQTQERIFEPFFTTKDQGESRGLGLASVDGCVKSHGGIAQVYSEVGRGTTIKVLLPRLLSKVDQEPPAAVTPELVRGEGTILVVDDEEIVRNFAARALRSLGYTVAMCANGLEAVEYFRDHHAEIDLVLLDMIMPKLSGEETFRQMKEIAPDVRVVIASGFSQNQTAVRLLQEGVYSYLNKPFRTEELSQEVARFIKV